MDGKGFFVCVEGLDGCGKTTQAKSLVERLKRKGYAAIYTAEPSSGKIGSFIKKYCLYGEKRVSSVVEALLFAADRFEHGEQKILPALQKGKIVVSDRYVYSSFAYQGATDLDVEWIEKINIHSIKPDLAIFLDVDPETVIQRLNSERSVMEKLDIQRKVQKIYRKFAEEGDLVKLDGNRPQQEVADDLFSIVLKILKGKSKM